MHDVVCRAAAAAVAATVGGGVAAAAAAAAAPPKKATVARRRAWRTLQVSGFWRGGGFAQVLGGWAWLGVVRSGAGMVGLQVSRGLLEGGDSAVWEGRGGHGGVCSLCSLVMRAWWAGRAW